MASYKMSEKRPGNNKPLKLVDLEEPEPGDDLTLYLPQEIWIKIASFLTLDDLCQLSLVSRRFYGVAMDPILWPTICIKSDAISGTETVVKLIQRCSFLSHLTLQCRDDISDLLKAVAKHSKRLKTLDVRFCPILTYQDLEHLSLHCPEISTLDLECTGCLNKDSDQHEMEGSNTCSCLPSNSFTSVLRNFKLLNHLNLFACKNLNSRGLQEIADSCCSLQSLDIDEVNYLSDDAFIYFISKVKTRLKRFWVDGETLTDKSFSAFGDLQQLELLSVSFADNMKSRGLASISNLKNLEWLKIRRGNQLIAPDFVQAFSDGKLKKLLYLDLSECSKLSDLGLITVAKNCPMLATLNLCWCWELTDSSLKFIVNYCRLLINLNLCGVVRCVIN